MSLLATTPTIGVAEIATALVGCLCDELATTPGGAPCWCGTVPGQLVAMDCGCDTDGCGMGYVRLDAMFPSRTFPTPDLAAANCAAPLAARFMVGCFRCVPVMDEAGHAPSETEQAAATGVLYADMAAIYTAIRCCVGDVLHLGWSDVAVGTWQPIGPTGGCAGGQWPVTVRVV